MMHISLGCVRGDPQSELLHANMHEAVALLFHEAQGFITPVPPNQAGGREAHQSSPESQFVVTAGLTLPLCGREAAKIYWKQNARRISATHQ